MTQKTFPEEVLEKINQSHSEINSIHDKVKESKIKLDLLEVAMETMNHKINRNVQFISIIFLIIVVLGFWWAIEKVI